MNAIANGLRRFSWRASITGACAAGLILGCSTPGLPAGLPADLAGSLLEGGPTPARDDEANPTSPGTDPDATGGTQLGPIDAEEPGDPMLTPVDLSTLQVFPPDNWWNQDVSDFPVHPNSANFIANIGATKGLHPDFGTVWQGAPIGIPFVIVRSGQARVPVSFYYPNESDPGPYPIPPDAPIEGGPDSTGDRHILVLDYDNRLLYEVFDAHPDGAGGWNCGSGAIFDLTSNDLRPMYWTSADAAGLPIFPGLVRYDEVVERGEINHALRFTVSKTQRAFITPARHWASNSTDPNRPPMGLRLRLKASFDLSPYPANVQVILRALKKYGMFVADNGSDWYISGVPDSRWNDSELHMLKQVKGSDFEVVYTGDPTTP